VVRIPTLRGRRSYGDILSLSLHPNMRQDHSVSLYPPNQIENRDHPIPLTKHTMYPSHSRPILETKVTTIPLHLFFQPNDTLVFAWFTQVFSFKKTITTYRCFLPADIWFLGNPAWCEEQSQSGHEIYTGSSPREASKSRTSSCYSCILVFGEIEIAM